MTSDEYFEKLNGLNKKYNITDEEWGALYTRANRKALENIEKELTGEKRGKELVEFYDERILKFFEAECISFRGKGALENGKNSTG